MGRTVLVSGGNRGIGLAVVQGLAKINPEDTILLGCRDLDEGIGIAKLISDNVKAVNLDLSTKEKLSSCVDKIKSTYDHVDVLINNAAILKEGTFLETSEEDFMESLQINLISAYKLMRSFVPGMAINNYGRVVNVSSGWGAFSSGLSGPFLYSLTKASLNALSLSASIDMPSNLKINSVCTGWVRTRMSGETAARSPQEGAQTILWLANLGESGPTGGFYRDEKEIEW